MHDGPVTRQLCCGLFGFSLCCCSVSFLLCEFVHSLTKNLNAINTFTLGRFEHGCSRSEQHMLKINIRVSLLLPFPHGFVDNLFLPLIDGFDGPYLGLAGWVVIVTLFFKLLLDLQISWENSLTASANAICKDLGNLPSTTCLSFWERHAKGQTGGWNCVGQGRDSQVRLVGPWRLCQPFLFVKALSFQKPHLNRRRHRQVWDSLSYLHSRRS